MAEIKKPAETGGFDKLNQVLLAGANHYADTGANIKKRKVTSKFVTIPFVMSFVIICRCAHLVRLEKHTAVIGRVIERARP